MEAEPRKARKLEIIERNKDSGPGLKEILGLRIKSLQERTKDLAQKTETDAMTGLLNRGGFMTRMQRLLGELSNSRRSGDVADRRAAIIAGDIDFFKKVNDTYGHQAGDEVLRRVAAALRDSVRASDLVARFGGEEFIIGVVDGDREQIRGIAENLRKSVEALQIDWAGKRIPVTMSFGVDEIDPKDDIEEVIARADVALYAAKNDGRNVVKFTESQEK